jgi:hypothetical protein
MRENFAQKWQEKLQIQINTALYPCPKEPGFTARLTSN